jgi:hypothetical protein
VANPTTNYGFILPTSSDLVTDLPADFDIALQGVDTRLKALQPGTTLGDLAYSSATANTNTRLGIGSTGQVLTVSGGVPSWATPSSGSANVAGKNGVINSNFSVWQRGTSISIAASTAAASGYSADRWDTATGANQAITISRQTTSDTTNLPFVQYCARYQRNSGQTGTGALTFAQNFESINSIQYAGKTVTFSFYARSGSNYSATSNTLNVYVWNGTGTDQNIVGAGFTGQNAFINSSATLTTTWQRFTFSATVPTNATQIATGLSFTPTGTASTNDFFEVTGVQFEVASAASAYSPNTSTQALELAACQRYYYKDTKAVLRADQTLASSIVYGVYYLPQEMRTTPTLTQTGGATETSNTSATTFSNDGSSSNTRKTGIYITGGASTGTVYMYRSAEWSAEL